MFFVFLAFVAVLIFFGPSFYLWRSHGESALFIRFVALLVTGLIIQIICFARRENRGLFIFFFVLTIAGLCLLNTYFLQPKVTSLMTSLLGLTTLLNALMGVLYSVIGLGSLILICHDWAKNRKKAKQS
ncbi:MAG: hypothetical protein MUP45_00585 [Candidatus Marinimicrobia bacterium]|nr:hypothetical protein [Candidatus Neomarinimicrobiota bacterium]